MVVEDRTERKIDLFVFIFFSGFIGEHYLCIFETGGIEIGY